MSAEPDKHIPLMGKANKSQVRQLQDEVDSLRRRIVELERLLAPVKSLFAGIRQIPMDGGDQ